MVGSLLWDGLKEFAVGTILGDMEVDLPALIPVRLMKRKIVQGLL